MIRSRSRTIHADDPAGEAGILSQSLMNPESLAGEIGVEGAEHDSGMPRVVLVKS